MFLSDVVRRLHVHRGISIAILANGAAVEDIEWPGFRNVLFTPIQLETGNSQLEEFGDTLLPVLSGRGVGQIGQWVIVRLWRLTWQGVALCQCFLLHLSLKE